MDCNVYSIVSWVISANLFFFSRAPFIIMIHMYISIQFGETIIDTSARKLYTKKVNGTAIERGVAFPVCVSINDVICNNCPLASDELVSR